MKNKINIILVTLSFWGMVGCNGDNQFEGELYKKVIYLLSDNDLAFKAEHDLSQEESTGYITVYCSGTEHIKSDVTVGLESDNEVLARYNKLNYDIDQSKFARLLDSDRYELTSFKTTLRADNPDNYTLIPIRIRPEGLSPDSIYMIPLRIKSVSDYEINPQKQSVLYQILLKNKYATTKTTTYYQGSGTEVKHSSIGDVASGISTTRAAVPLSKNQVRIFVGIHSYNPIKLTKEEVDKYGMVLTINDDKSITITPSGSLEIEMIGGATDNYCTVSPKGYFIFNLHYKYKDLITATVDNKTVNENAWVTMNEKCVQVATNVN